jgi:hypothetical protein
MLYPVEAVLILNQSFDFPLFLFECFLENYLLIPNPATAVKLFDGLSCLFEFKLNFL